MQHETRFGGGGRLCARVLFMRYAPPLRPSRIEDATLRAIANGARTLTRHVAYPNAPPRTVHPEVDLYTRLEQIHALGDSADTAEETVIDVRVAVSELHLFRRPTTPTGTVDLSGSATEGGEEDIDGGWRGTTRQQPQVQTPCGSCAMKVFQTVRGSLLPVGSLTRTATWKTYRGSPEGETICSG